MKQYILLLFIMIPLLSYSKTDMEKLLERVDHAIEMDSYYQQQKEKELKRLRRQAGDAITAEERLCYLDSLYRAYSNYRYDSSCAYVSKGLQLAEATHNTFYITHFKIHRASVLSVGGFYAKAEGILETLDPKQMPYKQSCITTSPMPGCSITGNLTQPNRNLQTTSKPRRSIIWEFCLKTSMKRQEVGILPVSEGRIFISQLAYTQKCIGLLSQSFKDDG